MSKLKFLNFLISKNNPNFYLNSTLKYNLGIVENPTDYNKVKDGIYIIRGNKKHHYKEYHVFQNIWYLMNDKTKDNGNFMCVMLQHIYYFLI